MMEELVELTVGGLLRRAAEQYPDRLALEHKGHVWSYKKLDRAVDRAARRLLAWGVRKGDHLGIWCEAEPAAVLMMYAAVRIGAVTALINTSLRRKELKNIIEHTDIRWLLIGDGFKDLRYPVICQGLPEEVPHMEGIAYIGESGHSVEFPELKRFGMASEADLHRVESQVKPEDIAYIVYTSGTTNFPKAVLGTHFSRVNIGIQTAEGLAATCEDRFCSALPLYHCFGLSVNMMVACAVGACLYLPASRKTYDLLWAISKGRCTVLSSVPSIFIAMLRRADFHRWDVSSVRTGLIAGSMYSFELFQEIEERFGMTLTSGLGLSETTAGLTFTSVEDPFEVRAKSVGWFPPHMEGKIMDIETGETLPAGEIGEVCARGYGIMEGYYNRPVETARVLDSEGWFRTGDMGYLDEQGNLHLTGRLKELIKRGGENISPAEIEAAVADNEQIELCKAVGVPSEFYGEEVCLCVTLREGAILNEEELREELKKRLAHFKLPRYILCLKEMPTTPTGKISFQDLRAVAREKLDL